MNTRLYTVVMMAGKHYFSLMVPAIGPEHATDVAYGIIVAQLLAMIGPQWESFVNITPIFTCPIEPSVVFATAEWLYNNTGEQHESLQSMQKLNVATFKHRFSNQ